MIVSKMPDFLVKKQGYSLTILAKNYGPKNAKFWLKSKAIGLLFWQNNVCFKNANFLVKKQGFRLTILAKK